MYILQNALRNVWRHKGRNALLGAIMLVVIAASVIALMISATSTAIIADYKERFSSEVKFQPNMERVREEAMAESTNGLVRMTMPTIDADQYLAYGDSKYLADAVYTASTGIVLDGITAVDADLGGGTGMMIAGGGGPGAEAQPETERMSFMESLQGGKFDEFDDGTRALASGEFPDDLGEVLVSTELADLNDIEIGDTLSASGELNNLETAVVEPISYELTVVGTYDDLTEEYGNSPQQNAFTNRRNEVLTTYETVLQNYISGLMGMRIEATFFLQEPDMLGAFTDEVRAKGLPEVFDVSTDSATYDKIVGPVEGLQGISLTFMIVVLSFGGVIIALLSSIAIRERKYEIGVLRAMGMKKHGVGLGLWFEILAVTAASTATGLLIGVLVAQPVTNVLLAGQVAAAESAQAETQGGMGPGLFPGAPSTVDAEPLTELSVALTPLAVAQIAGLALVLATLAGLVTLSRITKYEPIKILQERN
jgi:putative ABC transport system permease protein